ncbi:hypothetical protein ES705_33401 [subsurface metagenome]
MSIYRIRSAGDQKTEATWSVSANPEYGYPGPFDREVHKAIEQIIGEILREKRKIENPIPFSIYNLCNRMGVTDAGDNYQRIRKALEKIQMTGIKSEGAFYHKGKKKWISAVFGLYDGVIFKGEQIEGDIIAEINLLYLGDIYLQSLNSHNIKSIDYTYWQNLKSKIASRLYEILGVKFYGIRNKKEDFIRYKYSTLCQLLPLTPYRFISDAKRQLNSGNNELKETGFISKYDWSETSRKGWLIYYWPGERAKEEIRRAERAINNRTEEYLPGPQSGLEYFSQEQKDLIDKLVESNVSRVTAEDLIISYDQQLIEKWVKAIDYAKAEDKAAYLVKAIRENWQVPEGYLSKEEEARDREEQEKIRITREKQEEEKNKRRQEENEKLEQIYNSLDPLQQEKIKQEAENRLPDFWKEQLSKERIKGETSRLARIALEEKKREVMRDWFKEGKINKDYSGGRK